MLVRYGTPHPKTSALGFYRLIHIKDLITLLLLLEQERPIHGAHVLWPQFGGVKESAPATWGILPILHLKIHLVRVILTRSKLSDVHMYEMYP